MGKHFRFFEASRFSLEWLCLNADKLIIVMLKLKLASASESSRIVRCKEIPTPNGDVNINHEKASTKMKSLLAQLT